MSIDSFAADFRCAQFANEAPVTLTATNLQFVLQRGRPLLDVGRDGAKLALIGCPSRPDKRGHLRQGRRPDQTNHGRQAPKRAPSDEDERLVGIAAWNVDDMPHADFAPFALRRHAATPTAPPRFDASAASALPLARCPLSLGRRVRMQR